MGATMVKNGNLLDALPSQVFSTNYPCIQTCITKLCMYFQIKGNSTRSNAWPGFCWQNNSSIQTKVRPVFKYSTHNWLQLWKGELIYIHIIYILQYILIFLSWIQVHGTIGRAKGVHFLVWDVGGQEKLRPLWRSYTRYEQHLYTPMAIVIGKLWHGATLTPLIFFVR